MEQINQTQTNISMLFLDAENLKIPNSNQIEIYLQKLCKYPIQVKIAFADWTNKSMKNTAHELDQINYVLVHVLPGENSADKKMEARAKTILTSHPQSKEVFICSTDKGFLSLCNYLLEQGLIVYQVTRHKDEISVTNLVTNEIYPLYNINLENLINHLIELMKKQANQWISFTKICQLSEQKFQINLADAIQNYYKCASPQIFFKQHEQYFATHQITDDPELYISLFNLSPLNQNKSLKNNVNSEDDLELVILNILQSLTTSGQFVSVGQLGSELHKQLKEPPKHIFTRLKIQYKFIEWLQLKPNFIVKTENKSIDITYQ